VLVRGLPSSLQPAPRSFHRTFIEHPDFWEMLGAL